MLIDVLTALLREHQDIQALAVIDDLGAIVSETAAIPGNEKAIAVLVRAWLAAHATGAGLAELRAEGPSSAFLVRTLGPATVVADLKTGASLGRIALVLRLQHSSLVGALP